ncbi:hypothetical protein C8R47DRAFT_1083668 [Mycena vitilis]|nr:hypothetical protein C8R47DRAFT_1083668 [Mycena vitilis]
MKAQGMAQESVGVAALRGKLSPSKEKLARRWCGGGAVVARRMRRLNVSDAARAQSDAARHLEDAAPVVVDAAMSGGLVQSVASTSVLSGYHDTDHVQRYDGTATAVELNPDPWYWSNNSKFGFFQGRYGPQDKRGATGRMILWRTSIASREVVRTLIYDWPRIN